MRVYGRAKAQPMHYTFILPYIRHRLKRGDQGFIIFLLPLSPTPLSLPPRGSLLFSLSFSTLSRLSSSILLRSSTQIKASTPSLVSLSLSTRHWLRTTTNLVVCIVPMSLEVLALRFPRHGFDSHVATPNRGCFNRNPCSWPINKPTPNRAPSSSFSTFFPLPQSLLCLCRVFYIFSLIAMPLLCIVAPQVTLSPLPPRSHSKTLVACPQPLGNHQTFSDRPTQFTVHYRCDF